MVKENRWLVGALMTALLLAYTFTLIVSAAHLAQWYARYNQGLPMWVAYGLAGALEMTAFVLSLTSNALKGKISPWAMTGANAALGLVWVGNGYAMYHAAPGEPLWATVLATGFVGLTLVIGKVMGDLIGIGFEAGTPQSSVQVGPPVVQTMPRQALALKTADLSGLEEQSRVSALTGSNKSNGQTRLEDAATRFSSGERDHGATLSTPRQAPEQTELDALFTTLSARGEACSAGELAGTFGVSASTMRRRLERLKAQGRVSSNTKGWSCVVIAHD